MSHALAYALCLLACGATLGQDRGPEFPLGVKVEDASHLSRTCGPVRLQLEFDWPGPGVFDGALAVELRDSENILLGEFVIDPLYLSAGRQRQEVMLPGFRVHSLNDELTLRLTPLDKDRRPQGWLRPQALRVPGGAQRSLVIATCRPEIARDRRDQNDVADLLHLEELFPDYQATRPARTILTRTVFLPAEELPEEPLRLCTYDVVLLSGDALALAREKELAALLGWVRAGGGLCLVVDESRLRPYQTAFVNALAGASDADPRFLTNSDGALVYGAAEVPDSPLQFHVGLGRAVLLGWNDELLTPAAPHWRLTTAYLWRVRREHLGSVAKTGLWDAEKTLTSVRRAYEESHVDYGDQEAAARMQATDMAPIPVSGVTGLVTYLMPQGLKLVPLPLIALVLMLYVAVIGPLDYLVLGRLRLRRFTWLTFPAVTLAFTTFALLISNRYMRTADHRAGVTFRDVADGGRVARENRLEILFPSTSRQMVTEVPRGLFMPLRFQDFGQGMMWMYGPYGYPQWNETRATPALLDGRMPSAFRAVQLVPQWTPQLNRLLTIPLQETQATAAAFDWDQVPDFRTPGADGALAERIRTAFGHDVTAWLYHGYEVKTILGDSDLLSRGSNWEQVYVAGQYTQRQADFVKDVCAPLQPGFFAVVSELAPTGGDRFDDMALLDPTDERQWALAIAVPAAEGLVVYRRRYILEEKTP